MTRSVIAIITVDGMGYILVAHQGRRCVPDHLTHCLYA